MMRSGAFIAVCLCVMIYQRVQARGAAFKSGKFMIGALLPITEGPNCQNVEPRIIQIVETFIYEMKKIISMFEDKRNITLGYNIRDTCSSSNKAIEDALGFVSGEPVNSTCQKNCDDSDIVAVLGPEILENVALTAGILGLNHIPQVIFTGKTRLHSNTALYNTLTSTALPITDSALALTRLLAYFGWKTVNVVGFDDMYGREITSLLTQNLRTKNICISIEKLLEKSNLDVQISEVIESLRSNSQVTVTVLVAQPDVAAKVLEEARHQNFTGHIWIGRESWAADNVITTKYKDVLQGMLGIGYHENKDKEAIRSLVQETSDLTYDDWFKRLYGINATSGLNRHVIKSRDFQLDRTMYVQSAVQAIGDALEHVLENMTREGIKPDIKQIRIRLNRVLLKYIRLQNGFTFLNYQRLPSGEFKMVTVGSWRKLKSKKDSLVFDKRAIQWPGANRHSVPLSGSVKPCGPGTYMKKDSIECGWECARCPPGTYSKNYTSLVCIQCPENEIPNQLQIECLVAKEEFVRPSEVFGIIILSASVLGFTMTSIVLGIFLKYQNTPLIRASNMGFCVFTLVLLLVWFVSSSLFLLKPKAWICKLRTIVVPLLYTSVSALLLTKTKRLIRIFSALKRNRFLSNYWYSFVAISIVLVQVIISIVYLVFKPPDQVKVYHKDLTASSNCSRNLSLEIASFSYNCLLAFLCALFAVKSRKLPETYSEAKHICLAMLTYFISWMVYFFGYYGIPHSKLKAAVPSLGVILGAYAVLLFIFVPKIRVILFLPEKNTKSAALAATRKYSVDVAFGIQMYSRACERRHTLPALPVYADTKVPSPISTPDKNCNSLGPRFLPKSLDEAIKEDEGESGHANHRYSLDDTAIDVKNLSSLTPNGVA